MTRNIRFSQAPRNGFPDRDRLRQCLQETVLLHQFRLSELQYTFVSDEELLEMNAQFLAHDYYTDILTFDLSENECDIEGDIYISRDRVRDNAQIAGVSVEEEFCRVIGHGLLHLCGLKDKTPNEQAAMKEAEDRFISLYKQTA